MQPTTRTKVRRVPKRGLYDLDVIKQILDKDFICHVAFIHEGMPVVIPTLYGRHEDFLYLHGSMASRMMKNLAEGIDISLSVAMVNGLVLARSAFHHSANYESVVLFGRAMMVIDAQEKENGLRIVSEHIIPGRWEECRQPNAKELKGTMLLKIGIDEASAKIREGGPVDDKEDYALDIWAGVVPIKKYFLEPEVDTNAVKNLPKPDSVLGLKRWNKF